MPLRRHLTATFILSAITLNLLFWTVLLLITVATRSVIRSERVRRASFVIVDRIYRLAVQFHSFLIRRCLGIEVRVHGEVPDDPRQQYIVVSNHRSWFDILIVQDLITARGPMLKFLVKQELIYVPIVGWICLALDFPRLTRGKGEKGRDHDARSIATAAASLNETPGALLNFAEGTRFSRIKQRAHDSNYRHLLTPRSRGLSIILQALEVQLIDVTLVYPSDNINFWQCLGGELRCMEVWLDRFHANDVDNVKAWLEQRWHTKDERIEHSTIRTHLADNS